MPRANLPINGDNIYTEKVKRIQKLTPETESKIDWIPGVVNGFDSTSTTDALSAAAGRLLQDQINELKSRGRFLSTWDCTTWLPDTDPVENPHYYATWDYYIIGKVGSTNYRPHWDRYEAWVASTTIETAEVKKNDQYLYDWQNWVVLSQTEIELTIDQSLSTTSTNAVENRVITNAINTKQNVITDLATIRTWASAWATAIQPWDNISELTNNSWFQTAWDVANALLSKQDKLIAWENIQIGDDWTISASNSTYIAWDFDIKDLADSNNLRERWNNKQSWFFSRWSTWLEPEDPIIWDMYFNTNERRLYQYDWHQWVSISGVHIWESWPNPRIDWMFWLQPSKNSLKVCIWWLWNELNKQNISDLNNDAWFITASYVGNWQITVKQWAANKWSFTLNQSWAANIQLERALIISQAEYSQLATPDNNTMYFISDWTPASQAGFITYPTTDEMNQAITDAIAGVDEEISSIEQSVSTVDSRINTAIENAIDWEIQDAIDTSVSSAVSSATFTDYLNYCKSYWSVHTSWSSWYTMQWYWWVVSSYSNAYQQDSYIYINWTSVWHVWQQSTLWGAWWSWPYTLKPWDTVSWSYCACIVYDYY